MWGEVLLSANPHFCLQGFCLHNSKLAIHCQWRSVFCVRSMCLLTPEMYFIICCRPTFEYFGSLFTKVHFCPLLILSSLLELLLPRPKVRMDDSDQRWNAERICCGNSGNPQTVEHILDECTIHLHTTTTTMGMESAALQSWMTINMTSYLADVPSACVGPN